MNGRPLATRPIRENDYLPLEPEEIDVGRNSAQPTFRYFVSATQLPKVGSFGREAQATYLYDKVRVSIETGESVVAKLYHLGRELQGLLAVVMEQLDGRWGIYCGATQMLITFVAFLFLSMSANSSKWIVHASPSCTRPNARFQYSCELQTDH